MTRNDQNAIYFDMLSEKDKHIEDLRKMMSFYADNADSWEARYKRIESLPQAPAKKKKPVVRPDYLRVI
ncbi:MAG: hypothetical protein HOD92_02860 [Deltaproteobacteria bacterium]|jgi:hypothetical protein|nr:hypothetical protein [Deltaproteobacteria bacterium]